MSKVEYIGSYYIFTVIHKDIEYECVTSSDCKNLFKCTPEPENWVEMENIIRDAAFNLEIKNFD